jgi:hypothetical protein
MDFKIDTKSNEETKTTDITVTFSNGKKQTTSINNRKYELETQSEIYRAILNIVKQECVNLLIEKGFKVPRKGRIGTGDDNPIKEKHRKAALDCYYRKKAQKSPISA